MNSYFFTVAGSLLFSSCATVSLLGSLAVLLAWLTPSFDMSVWDGAVLQAVACQEDKQNHYFLKTLFLLSHFYEHVLMVQSSGCHVTFSCVHPVHFDHTALSFPSPVPCSLLRVPLSPLLFLCLFVCLNLHSTWGFKPFWVWLLSLSMRSSRFHPFSCKGRDLVFPYGWIKRHCVNITFFIVAIHGLMAT